jgi:hypothetical protein
MGCVSLIECVSIPFNLDHSVPLYPGRIFCVILCFLVLVVAQAPYSRNHRYREAQGSCRIRCFLLLHYRHPAGNLIGKFPCLTYGRGLYDHVCSKL